MNSVGRNRYGKEGKQLTPGTAARTGVAAFVPTAMTAAGGGGDQGEDEGEDGELTGLLSHRLQEVPRSSIRSRE